MPSIPRPADEWEVCDEGLLPDRPHVTHHKENIASSVPSSARPPARQSPEPLPQAEGDFHAKRQDESHRSPSPFPDRRSKKRHQIWLHVYDLDAVTARMNESFLRSWNLGAFHCGVQVLGREWFSSWGLTDETGVIWHAPKMHAIHIYKESLCMGESPLSEDEIKVALLHAMDTWPENSYHPILRNCVTFAEELLEALKVPEPFPTWVKGAADAGKSRVLFPIADYGWEWVKWWNAPERPPTSLAVPTISEVKNIPTVPFCGARSDSMADVSIHMPSTTSEDVREKSEVESSELHSLR